MIPKSRIPSMTRVVMTGRRIKSSAIFMNGPGPLPSVRFLIWTLVPETSWNCPSITTISPAFSPFFNNRTRPFRCAGFNRPISAFRSGLIHKYVLTLDAGLNRLGRDHQGIGLEGQAKDQVDKLTGPRSFRSLLRKVPLQADGTGCSIDGIIDEGKQAFFRMGFIFGDKGL